jgi:hypothetical protein
MDIDRDADDDVPQEGTAADVIHVTRVDFLSCDARDTTAEDRGVKRIRARFSSRFLNDRFSRSLRTGGAERERTHSRFRCQQVVDGDRVICFHMVSSQSLPSATDFGLLTTEN